MLRAPDDPASVLRHLPARPRTGARARTRGRWRARGRRGRRRRALRRGARDVLSSEPPLAHCLPDPLARRRGALRERAGHLRGRAARRVARALPRRPHDSRRGKRDPRAGEKSGVRDSAGKGRGLRSLSRRHRQQARRRHARAGRAHSRFPGRAFRHVLSRHLRRAAVEAGLARRGQARRRSARTWRPGSSRSPAGSPASRSSTRCAAAGRSLSRRPESPSRSRRAAGAAFGFEKLAGFDAALWQAAARRGASE